MTPPRLTIPDAGPCARHPCDQCRTCQRGRCCRSDNPDYQLPALGDWDGPIFGELGKLEDRGDAVVCHACGRAFVRLDSHARHAHDLTAEEYRAVFGLGYQTPLASSDFRATMRDQTRAAVKAGRLFDVRPLAGRGFGTPEQHAAAVAKSRERLASKLQPRASLDGHRKPFPPGPRSDSTKQAISRALAGKPKSEQHRQRIAAGVRKARARQEGEQ